VFALLLSLLATILSILSLIERIEQTPIILITDENAISVSSIYFPSMTYCETTRMDFGEEFYGFDFFEVEEGLRNGSLSLEDLSEHK
jgi:hypothetical protein